MGTLYPDLKSFKKRPEWRWPMAFKEVIAFLNSELKAANSKTEIRPDASKRKVFSVILKNKKILEEPFMAHPRIQKSLKKEYDKYVPSVRDYIVTVLKVMLLLLYVIAFASAWRLVTNSEVVSKPMALPQPDIGQDLEPIALMPSENVTHAVAVPAPTVTEDVVDSVGALFGSLLAIEPIGSTAVAVADVVARVKLVTYTVCFEISRYVPLEYWQ